MRPALRFRSLLILLLAFTFSAVIFSPPSCGQTPGPDPAAQKTAQATIDDLNKQIASSNQPLADAQSYAGTLSSLADPRSNWGTFDDRLAAIDSKLKLIAGQGLIKNLTSFKDAINPSDPGKSGDVQQLGTCDATSLGADLAATCTTAVANGKARSSDLDTASKNLVSALNDLPGSIQTTLDNSASTLAKFSDSWGAPDSLALDDFNTHIADYNEACSNYNATSSRKTSMEASLTNLGVDAAKNTALDSSLTALAAKLKDLAGKVEAILKAAQKNEDDGAKAVSTATTNVQATPIASGDDASKTYSTNSKLARDVDVLDRLWQPFLKSIKSCGGLDDTHIHTLATSLSGLQSSEKDLRSRLSKLNEALTGDAAQFEDVPILLYYYTEVEKLMRSLNDSTDWSSTNAAAAEAANQRNLLLDAEGRVAQARGEVADLQFALQKLLEQQRQSEAATSQLGLLSQQAARNKQLADRNLDRATQNFADAQAALDADPTNASKKQQLQKATDAKNAATTHATDANTKNTTATNNHNDALSKQSAADADKDSLQSRIDLAQNKLNEAQSNYETMQRDAYRAALAESDAYAAARDQTPFLIARANAASTDPVRRVIMFGYPDRNLIVVRGKPGDVSVVGHLISDYDTPAPQARLTLWSTEISAELKKPLFWWSKPEDKLNEATAIVDNRLGLARQQIAEATSSLRQNVNDAVRQAERSEMDSPDVCTRLSITRPLPDDPQDYPMTLAEFARWRRFRFYSPDVLAASGVNMSSLASFRNALLPDPAATTTVGEALMILSLSCSAMRQEVFGRFQQAVRQSPSPTVSNHTSLASTNRGKKWEQGNEYLESTPDHYCFLGTAQALLVNPGCGFNPPNLSAPLRSSLENRVSDLERALNQLQFTPSLRINVQFPGHPPPPPPLPNRCSDPVIDLDINMIPNYPDPIPGPAEGLTDSQLEIVRALHAGYSRKVLRELNSLRPQILKLQSDFNDWRESATSKPNYVSTCDFKAAEIETLTNSYNTTVNTRLKVLYPNEYKIFQIAPSRPEFEALTTQSAKRFTKELSQTGPRVAAADEMLKRMMSRLEDDLDQQYIQPMLKQLRADLINEGLTVGIIQRTSVLATNRLKARVDPKGMYDLSVGEQQDLLASLGQLASIYMSAQTSGLLGAFGALNSQPQKQEARLYGVTTGSKFEVTPIFDPSGQALRFKFDYVSNSLIRNPKGTIDPTMPSIRHTINTEVQLSNLEIREVSRYESNAKLGIPTRYYGGIPLLTDIPGLKPIPLIGWFVRRAGSNAEAQQSVIFGQTTIYPTIGSIVDLLQTGN